MKNRFLSKMIKTYQALINRLKWIGIWPTHYVLDNKASTELNQTTKDNGMTHQLVPPDNSRINIAERVIQNAKSNVISVMCGVDPHFSMHLWDRSNRRKYSWTYSASHVLYLRYPPTPTCMIPVITMSTQLRPWVSQWSTMSSHQRGQVGACTLYLVTT